MNRLKETRTKRGLTQKEVASAIGVTIATYSRYESGKYEPSFEKMGQLAEFFSVDITYLFNFNPGDIEYGCMVPEYIPEHLSSLYITLQHYGLEIEKKDLNFYLVPSNPTLTTGRSDLYLSDELYEPVIVEKKDLEKMAQSIDEFTMYIAVKLYKNKLKQGD